MSARHLGASVELWSLRIPLRLFRRWRFHSRKLCSDKQILEKAGSPRLVQKFIYEFHFEAVALLGDNVLLHLSKVILRYLSMLKSRGVVSM